MLFFNPFEQFIVNPFLSLSLYFIDISLTNITLTFGIFILGTVLIIFFLKDSKTNSLYIFPTHLDSVVHLAYYLCQYMVERHINVRYYQQAFFPLIFALAIFLLLINLGGNIPGCMSLTSQVGVVVAYALPAILGVFFWTVRIRSFTFIRTFHSPGMPGALAMILFPIEILTFVMRPVSIVCRLVANFMSGHIIFKVVLGGFIQFAYTKTSLSLIASCLSMFGVCSLVVLIILELAISVIQVYVFLVIFCMFLSDSFGHHFRH